MNQQKKFSIKKQIVLLVCCLFLVLPLAVNAANLTFSKNVKDNKARNLIQNVQIMLIEIGYDPGLPDGYDGLRTRAALQSFQRDNNLDTNGKMEKATVKALRKAYASDN